MIYPDIATQSWVDESTLLGEKRLSFHWRYLLLFEVIVVLIGFSISVCSASTANLVFPVLCMTLAIVLASGTWLLHSRISVHDNGIRLHSFLGSQVCLWTSIAQLFDNCDAYGQPTSLTIIHRNGYTIHIPNNLGDFNKLGQIIINRFIDINLDDSLTILYDGGVLYFGQVMLSTTYLEVSSKALLLSRIETFHLERYGRIRLRVWTEEQKLRWLAVSDFPVPNRHLLRKIFLTLRTQSEKHPPSPDEPDPDEFTFE